MYMYMYHSSCCCRNDVDNLVIVLCSSTAYTYLRASSLASTNTMNGPSQSEKQEQSKRRSPDRPRDSADQTEPLEPDIGLN